MALIETVELADARRPSGDPTNTSALRRTWRSVSELRLRQLRAQVRLAILEHDMLGLGGGLAMYTPAHARLKGFQEWLTQSANGVLGGGWPTPYVVAAWQSGHAAAMRETGKQATLDHYAAEHLAQLAQAEFVGIAGALVQQVIRASVQAVTRKLRPHRAYSSIVRPFDKMAVHRVRTNVNVITVAAHNAAKLAAYREMGVNRVGIIPEVKNGHVTHVTMRQTVDFNPHHEPAGSPEGGQFTSGGSEGGGGESGGALGHGYSKHATLKGDTIHTSDVYDAVRALYENRKVVLTQFTGYAERAERSQGRHYRQEDAEGRDRS